MHIPQIYNDSVVTYIYMFISGASNWGEVIQGRKNDEAHMC